MRKENKNFINKFEKDYKEIVRELFQKQLIKEIRHDSIKESNEQITITRENKENESNILFDKQISIDDIMKELLYQREYNILFYDRSIIQYEFLIENGKIKKERLIFIKKHNYLWSKEEISEKELHDIELDWFQEENGIPTIIRIDYDTENFEDVLHPITHMTLSNYDECRIPMMGAMSLYNFINFVLNFFYNESLSFKSAFSEVDITISDNERKRLHFEWK